MNKLIKKLSQVKSLKKTLMFIAVLMMMSTGVWGAKYRLRDIAGTSITANWTDQIWQKEITAGNYTDTTEYPNENDNIVYIQGTKPTTITISSTNIKCGNIYTNADKDSTGEVTLIFEVSPTITSINTNSGALSSGNTIISLKTDIEVTNLNINRKESGANNATGKTTIETGASTLRVNSKVLLNNDSAGSGNTSLEVVESGSVSCSSFDAPNNFSHSVQITKNSTFEIRDYFFGNSASQNTSFTGNGTLKIPASGAYMDYGSTCAFSYASTLKILPSKAPSYYSITSSGIENFDTSNAITISLKATNAHNGGQNVYFPFKVKKLTGATATFSVTNYTANNTTTSGSTYSLASDGSGFFYYPHGSAGSGTDKKVDITLSQTGTPAAGDGFKLDIYTPDNSRVLYTVEWYYQKPMWTGAISDDWDTVGNWIGLSAATVKDSIKTEDISINSSATRMPVISSGTAETKTLTIAPNASISVTGGTLKTNTLTVGEQSSTSTFTQTGGNVKVSNIVIDNNSIFSATGGKITFTNTTSTLDIKPSANAVFYDILVANTDSSAGSYELTVSNGNLISTGKIRLPGEDKTGVSASLVAPNGITLNGSTSVLEVTTAGSVTSTAGITLDNGATLKASADNFNSSPVINNGTVELYTSVSSFGALTNSEDATINVKAASINLPSICTDYGNGILEIDANCTDIKLTASITNLKKLIIKSGASLDLNGFDLSVTEIENNGNLIVGGNTLEVSTFSGAGTLSITGGTLKSTNTTATVTIPNVSITTDATLDGGTEGLILSNAIYTASPALTNKGKISLSGGTIGNLTISSGTTTLTDDISVETITIDTSTTLEGTSGKTISVNGDWTNNGTYNHNYGIIKFIGTKTVTGANNFDTLQIEHNNAPTTITFPANETQTIGTFSCTGTSTNTVTLTSSGTWKVCFGTNPSQSNFAYTIVENSESVTNSGTANNLGLANDASSVSEFSISDPTSKYWFTFKYYWMGTQSTDWTDGRNWTTQDSASPIMLVQSVYPDYTNKTSEIIVKDSSSNICTFPATTNLKSLTVNQNQTLEIGTAKYNLETVENNGTVNITLGETDRSITSLTENGTVVYKGTSLGILPWGTSYKNIIFDTSFSGLINDTCTISGTTNVKTSNYITFVNSSTFSGLVTINCTGNVNLLTNGNISVASSAKAGKLTIDASGSILLNGNVTTTAGDISQQYTCTTLKSADNTNITLTSTFAGTASSINIYATNRISIDGDFSISSKQINLGKTGNAITVSSQGNQTFTGKVTLNSNTTLLAGTNSVSFSSTVDGAYALNIGDGTNATEVTFSDIVGGTTPPTTLAVKGSATTSANITTSSSQTYGSTLSLNADSTLTASSITLNGNVTGSHTLTIAAPVTIGADLTVSTTQTNFNSNLEINTGHSMSCSGSFNLTGNWTNNGTFTGTGSTIHFAGTTQIGGTSITTFDNVVIDSGASVTAPASQNVNTSGNWTNNGGTFTHNSGTVTFTGSPTFTGETTFYNLTATGLGGKTLTLNDDLSVEGTLELSGTDASSRLSIVAGTADKGFILSSNHDDKGSYLSIASDVKIKYKDNGTLKTDGIEGRYFSASNSIPTAGTTDADWLNVIHNGWRIKNLGDFTYIWQGTDSDWATSSNWDIGIVPGVASLSEGATVTIPDSQSAYPKLDTTSYSVKSLTIESNASVSLGNSANITVADGASAGTLSNAGTIIYSSTGRILDESGTVKNDATQGTVEYTGTITDGIISNVSYYNLKISGGKWTSSNAISCNSITFEGSPEIKFNGGISASASSITVPSTAQITLGGTVSSSGTQTYNCAVNLSANTTLNASTNTITFAQNLNAVSGVTLNVLSPLSISNDVTIDVENGKYTDITAGTHNLTFTGNTECTSSLSASTGNTTFNGNVNLSYATFTHNNGTVVFNGTSTQDFLAKTDTIFNNITIESGSSITTSSTFKVAGDFTNNGTAEATSGSTISFSGTNNTISGSSTFNNIIFVSGANYSSTDAQIINGTTTINAGTGNTISLTGQNTFTGDVGIGDSSTSINGGNVTLTSKDGSSINLEANANADSITINGTLTLNGNITTTGTQEYTDKVTLAANVTLTAVDSTPTYKNITFGKNIEGPYDFTINGIVNINGESHTFDLKDSPNNTYKTATFNNGFAANANLVLKANAIIMGDNTFTNLSIDNSEIETASSVQFQANKTQTITDTFSAVGNQNAYEAGNKLSLISTSSPTQWKIKTAKQGNIVYVDIKDSNNISSKRLNANNPSTDSGNNIRWNFIGLEYTWTGATTTSGKETNWFEAANWDLNSIPGIGAKIKIPELTDASKKYPVLESDLLDDESANASVGKLGEIIVEENAQLNLSSHSIYSKSIKNSGRIILEGTQSIYADSSNTPTDIENANNSTVEYYGTCSTNPMKGTSGSSNYYNLEFSDGSNGTISDISVAYTTLIANGTGKTLSLTGANTFTGIVKIGDALTPTDAGTITINTSDDITIASSAKADSLSITATEKTITLKGDVTTTADALTLAGNLSTIGGTSSASPATISAAGIGLSLTGNWTNNGFISTATPIAISGNLINNSAKFLKSTSSTATSITGDVNNQGSIEFTETINITGSLTNSGTATCTNGTTVTANFADTGIWNSDSTTGHITLNGTGNQLVSLNSATTYNTIIANKDSGNLTFDKVSNVENLTITKVADSTFEVQANLTNLNVYLASNTIFNGPVQIGTLTDSATAGNFIFNANGFILSDTNFTTTGNVAFGSSADTLFSFATTDNATKYNLTHTTGETNLFGTLTANTIELAITNCKTNSTVNCDSITLNGNVNADVGVSYLKISGDLISKGNRTISPNLMLDGNFTADSGITTIGKTDAPADFYLYSTSASPAPISITPVTVTGNLIFNASRDISTSGRISAKNIVLYQGNLNAADNSTLYAEKDIVFLGSDYSLANLETGNETEYIYQNQNRLSSFNYLRPDFAETTTMPDGTSLPSGTNSANTFAGTYIAGNSSILYAGKNFYANGLSLNGANPWYVDVPDFSNASNGFGEGYNLVLSNSIVRCHQDNSADGSKARIPAYHCTDNGENQNWIFDDYEFGAIYTVRDNCIRIEFNRPLRNLNGELTSSLSRFSNSDSAYIGFFTDEDCTQPLENKNITSGIVYLKAENSWNTDANGSSAGTTASTDRTGLHKEVIPYVEVAKIPVGELSTISDVWGKKLKNYSGNNRYTDTIDETGPVLYSVKTGQETHIISDGTAESQHSYDAHNFIEFRYSEPVNFGSESLSDVWIPAFDAENNVNLQENTQVTDSFGSLKGNITSEGALNFVGLGTIENGKLYTGSKGQADKYVNALYRKDAYSLCVSIAGYTEDTVTDTNNYSYKKWVGYIESAKMPSGTVTMNFKTEESNLNPLVTDVLGNCQKDYPDSNQNTIPTVNSTEDGLYGVWDLSEPVFAPLRMTTIKTENGISTNNWTPDLFNGHYQSESIGNTSGVGSTLDRIEFHLFDNTPTFDSTEPEWVSEIGWINHGSEGKKSDLYKNYSYSADIFGGARKFDDDNTRRTSGGIRYSTICNESKAFKYINSMYDEPTKAFADEKAFAGANGFIFTGTATPRRSASDLDGLYFGMPLGITNFDIKETFTVSYDSTNSYITDLAGNRLRSATFTTIDRTPPSFDVTLSPLHKNELYITFVKKLITNSENIVYIDNSGDVKDVSLSGTFEQIIPSCFKLISIDENGNPVESPNLKIDTTRPAQIMEKTSDRFTCLKLFLTQDVTLKDVENLYVSITNHPDYNKKSQDPFTSHKDSLVTFIQDSNKNYMEMYSAHALSDFAISAINPLYGYDENMSVEDPDLFNGLYSAGTWGVHDWNADQQNYGTLPVNHALAIVAQTDDGTENRTESPLHARIYLSNNPDADSVSKQYNADFADNLRIWLPNQTDKVFAAMAEVNNKNFAAIDSELLQPEDPLAGIIFHLPKSLTETWNTGDQVSFLFAFTDETNNTIDIIHSPELDVDSEEQKYLTTSTKMPLYALRLTNPEDITSIDLWSFKLKTQTKQRGGVSILNNVINPVEGEKTIIEVDNPSDGSVNVIVMTLDGNIVSYLNRGELTQGEHFFTWDGKTKNGKNVARGLYFIRILGNGFDETRKVMIVK